MSIPAGGELMSTISIRKIGITKLETDAVVNADITAERVLIRGKVKGNVVGNKLIFITSSGSLDGDITTGKVVLEPGCIFTGKCSMVRNENEK